MEDLFEVLMNMVKDELISDFSLNYRTNAPPGLSGWSVSVNGYVLSEFEERDDPILSAISALREWETEYWCAYDDASQSPV